MKLQNLLKLIKADELLNIYDDTNNVYLYEGILKEDCDCQYNSCKVIEIMTNTNFFGTPIIEIDVKNNNDLSKENTKEEVCTDGFVYIEDGYGNYEPVGGF